MVGVNSNYNYYQSQVPPTFGGNNGYGNTSTNNVSNPYSGGDSYSVQNTSSAFDDAMAKFTGKPVFNANTATNSNQSKSTLPPGITQEEVNWALDLENKVKGGYSPNQQETAAYQALAAKMSNSQTNPVITTNTTTQVGAPISQEEVNWALDLENKVKGGYSPNPQETAKYQDIANRLQTAQTSSKPAVNSPTQEEVNWALDLENKVKGGYSPNPQETAKYQDIANRLQTAQASSKPAVNSPTQEEVNWALDLENKVKGGYSPNPQETAKYQDIANRLKSTQASGNNTNKDWTTWSQPFSVPRSVFQTTPRIIQVPATLRKINNSLPTNTSVNAGPNLNNTQTVSNNEIQWALDLENKVKSGYTPNDSELYQYKQIADKLQAMKNSGNTPNISQNNNVQNNTNQQKSPSLLDKMKNAWNSLFGKKS